MYEKDQGDMSIDYGTTSVYRRCGKKRKGSPAGKEKPGLFNQTLASSWMSSRNKQINIMILTDTNNQTKET